MKNDYTLEINIAKRTLNKVLLVLKKNYLKNNKIFYLRSNNKELKSKVDFLCNKLIIDNLKKTNFPIISEEKKNHDFEEYKDYQWIIDPIDGTYNYINNLGPCSSCIALFNGTKPIFGIVATFPDNNIYFGGPKLGSYKNLKRIEISTKRSMSQSTLMTGFPSNYLFEKNDKDRLFNIFKKVKKTRMIGAASISILKLGEAHADIYYEKNIMIWDIASSLAILKGAKGKTYLLKNRYKKNNYDVLCTSNVKNLGYFFSNSEIKKLQIL